jgi:hypothetical protein
MSLNWHRRPGWFQTVARPWCLPSSVVPGYHTLFAGFEPLICVIWITLPPALQSHFAIRNDVHPGPFNLDRSWARAQASLLRQASRSRTRRWSNSQHCW